MNETDENPKRTQAFIQIRIMNAMSDAAVMAANWGFPLENFLSCAENLYLGFAQILDNPEPEPVEPVLKVGEVYAKLSIGVCVITHVGDNFVRMRWIAGEYAGADDLRDDATNASYFTDAQKVLDRPLPATGQIWHWIEAQTDVTLDYEAGGVWFGHSVDSHLIVFYEKDFTNGSIRFAGYRNDRRR